MLVGATIPGQTVGRRWSAHPHRSKAQARSAKPDQSQVPQGFGTMPSPPRLANGQNHNDDDEDADDNDCRRNGQCRFPPRD